MPLGEIVHHQGAGQVQDGGWIQATEKPARHFSIGKNQEGEAGGPREGEATPIEYPQQRM